MDRDRPLWHCFASRIARLGMMPAQVQRSLDAIDSYLEVPGGTT
jgi:hypothetical protein